MLAGYEILAVGSLLEGSGVLSPPDAARAVDSADLAASIAVAPAVGHALSARVGIEVHVRRGRGAGHGHGHGRRNGEVVGLGRHSVVIH
jgi:hypothetical protein